MMIRVGIPVLLLVAACSSNAGVPGSPAPEVTPSAPWGAGALSASAVPAIYLTEWRSAENRATCAPIAFLNSAIEANATPRRANFGGGWGIAYDLPNQRSAFGIAGTGVSASEPTAHQWPFHRNWSDGSTAGYGPEGGGAGPNQLAYLRIAGQGCLYNVWSQLGRAHLESLMNAIRFVDTT